MKRLLALLATAGFLACAHAQPSQQLSIYAKAWIVVDLASGQTLTAEKPDERIEPASLTKLMTAYVVFQALREKKLTLEQAVPVSERAWRATGSKMFIEPRKPVTVDELIRGMVVQSGNDACIALAEAVGGSEEAFAQMMNREAERLGMKGTKFMNSSGLPDPQHVSTARDLQVLATALIRDFPAEYAQYYSQKEYRYNNITQSNRNRLLWLDPTVDGVKTGFTESAGYGLVASARRGERRLISVVLGAKSDALRTSESQKLLNFGFQAFETRRLYRKGEAVATPEIFKGTSRTLRLGFARDVWLTLPRDRFAGIRPVLETRQPFVAPFSAGQKAGIMRLTRDNATLAEFALVALEDVPVAGFLSRGWDTLRLLFR